AGEVMRQDGTSIIRERRSSAGRNRTGALDQRFGLRIVFTERVRKMNIERIGEHRAESERGGADRGRFDGTGAAVMNEDAGRCEPRHHRALVHYGDVGQVFGDLSPSLRIFRWMRADDESAGCDCAGERRYQREKMLEEGSSVTEKSGAKLVHVLGRHPVRDSESGLPGDEMIHHAKIAVEEDEVAEPILEGRDLRCVEWPQLHS